VSRVAERAGGGPDVLSRLRAVFDVIENDDRGRQIAPYELTLWALRRPESRDLARRQYEEYHRVATEATVAWMRETGVESPDQVRPLAQFVTALFDGLILAWLADPESTDVDGVLRLVSELVEDHLRNRNG
jgi:AcrR family transcriptional regulator